MRAINTTQNRARYNGEIFDNPIEAIEIIKSRPMLHKHSDSLNYTDESGWTGYESGEQFQSDYMASKVDLSTVNVVERKLADIQTVEKKRTQFFNDVVGFQPIVPLALMGVPCSMRNVRTVKQKSKIVNIVIDCTASANVSATEIANAAVSIVGQVVSLEKQGYRVNLMASFISCQSNHVDFVAVKVKDASQPLNLSKMLFPFSTAAFSRRLGFAWYERTESVKYIDEYGFPLFAYRKHKEALQNIIGKQTVILAVSEIIQGKDVSKAVKDAIA